MDSSDDRIGLVRSIFSGAVSRIIDTVPKHLPRAEFDQRRERVWEQIVAVLGTVAWQIRDLTGGTMVLGEFDQYARLHRAAEVYVNESRHSEPTFRFDPDAEAKEFVTKYMG